MINDKGLKTEVAHHAVFINFAVKNNNENNHAIEQDMVDSLDGQQLFRDALRANGTQSVPVSQRQYLERRNAHQREA